VHHRTQCCTSSDRSYGRQQCLIHHRPPHSHCAPPSPTHTLLPTAVAGERVIVNGQRCIGKFQRVVRHCMSRMFSQANPEVEEPKSLQTPPLAQPAHSIRTQKYRSRCLTIPDAFRPPPTNCVTPVLFHFYSYLFSSLLSAGGLTTITLDEMFIIANVGDSVLWEV
jgi:hypothetical protein